MAMALLTCLLALTGCGTIHNARMWFPKASGLDEITPQLYVEPSMTSDQRQELQRQIGLGRASVAAFYGGVTSAASKIACSSFYEVELLRTTSAIQYFSTLLVPARIILYQAALIFYFD